METIPNLFDERTHNMEFYAQKKIYSQLKLLNKLPIVQNLTGEFTNYVASSVDDVIGDVITTGDGLDFNEIKFGEPSAFRGATIPKGFMFKMNTRLAEMGRLDATLQVFLNKSVARLANFYDKNFLASLSTGAGATAATGLNTIDSTSTGIDVIENELKIIDAMEVKNNVDTGFTPTTVFLPRADATAIKIALAKSNLLDDSNFEYVPTSTLTTGQKLVMDLDNPTATIEKYGDPNYSFIASLEQEPEMNAELLMELPQSFINVRMTEPNEPQRSYVYIFAEAALNILEPNGIMFIDPQ
jgi:hypothetical protein